MPEERQQEVQTHPIPTIGPISWWSWRPGIKPRNALLIGASISLIGLLLGSIGLVTLVLSIMDSVAPPQQVPGVVLGHAVNSLDGQPYISIRISELGFPGEVSPVVSNTAYHAIHNGSPILLDYSPHLHALYALESTGQRYILPGSSIGSDLFGSLALLLIGGILLPYPVVLMIWGWCDLFGGEPMGRQREMKARVAGLRASLPNRKGRAGLMAGPARAWYGVALYPLDAPSEQLCQTFAISQERYSALHEGEVVRIKYSAHVHYVFALEPLEHE